jgi:hypothetical protein
MHSGKPSPVDERNQEERSFGTFADKKGLYDRRDDGGYEGGYGYERGHGYVDSVDSSRSVDMGYNSVSRLLSLSLSLFPPIHDPG